MTPSAAARVALEAWVRAEERQAQARPFEGLADLIGSVHGGDPGRSTRDRNWISRQLKSRRGKGSR